MIKFVENDLYFNEFNDYAALKIKILVKGYGFGYNFCRFWVQINESSVPTAIICMFYNGVTVSYNQEADYSELKEFVEFLSPYEICIKNGLIGFNLPYKTVNCLYKKSSKTKDLEVLNQNYNTCKKAFELLNNPENDFGLSDFDSWYIDINHRIRHNSAFVISKEDSCAICLTDGNDIIINGIAVSIDRRGENLGKKLLDEISSYSNFDGIYVLCENKLVGFYKKSKFEIIDKYCIYEGSL